MSRRRGSKSGKAPEAAPPRSEESLDAPLPARLLSERSGGWRKVLSSPDVAPMSLDRNLGFLTPDSDTEDTPPTAVPGQFRFEDDDDDDDEAEAPVPAVAPAEADLDEEAAFAALEAEISAARSAVRPAVTESEPGPAPVGEPGAPPKAEVAPAVTLPASEGWGWAIAALLGAALLVAWVMWG